MAAARSSAGSPGQLKTTNPALALEEEVASATQKLVGVVVGAPAHDAVEKRHLAGGDEEQLARSLVKLSAIGFPRDAVDPHEVVVHAVGQGEIHPRIILDVRPWRAPGS